MKTHLYMLIKQHQTIVTLLREMADGQQCKDLKDFTDFTRQKQQAKDTLSKQPVEKSESQTFKKVGKKTKLLSIDYACRYLGVARSTLAGLRKDGHLTDIVKGRSVRFRFDELKKIRKWYSIPKGKV